MYFFYIIIFILGLTASYTDIKFKKIKNSHLLIAIAAGLAIYIYLIASHQMAVNAPLAWNILIGIAIGLFLYLTDIWSAGDAKLFMVFCLLMPTIKDSSMILFPSVTIFINIFLASTLAILILSTNRIIKNKKAILKKIFSLSTLSVIGLSFLMIFCLQWIIERLMSSLIPQGMRFLSFIILFLLYQLIRKAVKKTTSAIILFVIFGLALALRFLIYPLNLNIENLFSYLKLTVCYTLLLHTLSIVINLKKSDAEEEKTIPFAPFIFLGVILTNTNFTPWIIHILNTLKK